MMNAFAFIKCIYHDICICLRKKKTGIYLLYNVCIVFFLKMLRKLYNVIFRQFVHTFSLLILA